jgi:ABC-type lipoprotein export system ATPase subunit
VILADEPTGNLDSVSSREICELLRQVNRAEKSAILVVTHDPQVAAAAERVNFLKDGRIAASCATQGDAALVSRKYLEIYG